MISPGHTRLKNRAASGGLVRCGGWTRAAPMHSSAGTPGSRPSLSLDRSVLPVFAGLMLGMFVASLNLTLVAGALPAIVAELGGIDRYSWIALSSMLASTVVVPIAGKLSDSFGRKPFYMGGILVFMAGSVLAGLAPTFKWLVAARA